MAWLKTIVFKETTNVGSLEKSSEDDDYLDAENADSEGLDLLFSLEEDENLSSIITEELSEKTRVKILEISTSLWSTTYIHSYSLWILD